MLKHAYQMYFNYMANWSPYWEWLGIFNQYIVIDDHDYDGNYINGIIDLTENWIGVRQSFL